MEKTRPTHTFLCVTLPRNSHTWNASSVCGAKRVHVTFPHRDTACWKSPFHSNATTMDVAHCSEPRYPAMTNKSPLYNGLLTWIGTDCAFWKERVISNRLYLGERRLHGMQQMAAERFSLLHKQGWPFMRGYSLAELHTGMRMLVGFSAQNVNKHNTCIWSTCSAE